MFFNRLTLDTTPIVLRMETVLKIIKVVNGIYKTGANTIAQNIIFQIFIFQVMY